MLNFAVLYSLKCRSLPDFPAELDSKPDPGIQSHNSAVKWRAERRPGEVVNHPALTAERHDVSGVVDDFERGRPVQTLRQEGELVLAILPALGAGPRTRNAAVCRGPLLRTRDLASRQAMRHRQSAA
jgi:hypothetical protein